MNIAFLTDWAQASAYAEFSFNLSNGLERLGHRTFIVAPKTSSAKPRVMQDGRRVFRFTPKNASIQILKKLDDWKIDVILVHQECMGDKTSLSSIVGQFTKGSRRSYLFVHNDNYDRLIPYNLFTGLLMPNRSFTQYPTGGVRICYLEQGIPEFSFNESLVEQFRDGKGLPSPKEGTVSEGYYLTTFEGKTPISDVLIAIDYINEYKLVNKPVYLFVQNQQGTDLQYKSPFYIGSLGYLDMNQLSGYFFSGDGSLFIYPEERGKYTSSAIRFAIGARSPVITNHGGHTNGVEDGITTWANGSSPEQIKQAIVQHFTNLPFRKRNADRIYHTLLPRMGWTVIAGQLQNLLVGKR